MQIRILGPILAGLRRESYRTPLTRRYYERRAEQGREIKSGKQPRFVGTVQISSFGALLNAVDRYGERARGGRGQWEFKIFQANPADIPCIDPVPQAVTFLSERTIVPSQDTNLMKTTMGVFRLLIPAVVNHDRFAPLPFKNFKENKKCVYLPKIDIHFLGKIRFSNYLNL